MVSEIAEKVFEFVGDGNRTKGTNPGSRIILDTALQQVYGSLKKFNPNRILPDETRFRMEFGDRKKVLIISRVVKRGITVGWNVKLV